MFQLQQCPRMWQRLLALQRSCHIVSTADSKKIDDSQLLAKLKQTEATIKQASSMYKPEEMMLCFNGGKDCTVLLDVLHKQLHHAAPLRAVCVKSHDPFEEVEQFIDASVERYRLKLQRCNGALKVAIEQVLAEHPQVRAMFLGCRRTDPGCEKHSDMLPCDNGWPKLMRIFPLLEWSYHDIWNYLRSQKLPYCPLYDQGYTSLGDRSSTRVNPSLLSYDEQRGKVVYRPAYELSNVTLERANREDTQVVKPTRHQQQNP